MKKIILATILFLAAFQCFAQQEYKATVFGVRSDGVTDNTSSIQYAIDFISQKGGGVLVFYVGRYLTGSVNLRSNVSIRLAEACVIVGSDNVYNYRGQDAIFNGKDVTNASIFGKGVIEGHRSDKALISLDGCSDITIDGLKLIGTSSADILKNNCGKVEVRGVTSTADGTLPVKKTLGANVKNK